MKTIEEPPDSPDTQPASSRRRLLEGSLFGALTLAAHLSPGSPKITEEFPSGYYDSCQWSNGHPRQCLHCRPSRSNRNSSIFSKEGTEAWISKVPGYISSEFAQEHFDGRRSRHLLPMAERTKNRCHARQCLYGSLHESHQRFSDSGQHDLRGNLCSSRVSGAATHIGGQMETLEGRRVLSHGRKPGIWDSRLWRHCSPGAPR